MVYLELVSPFASVVYGFFCACRDFLEQTETVETFLIHRVCTFRSAVIQGG